MKLKKISIEKIQVSNRVREDLGDLESLIKSIREYGLIQPVVVDDDYNLISGQRRLQAVKELGYTEIYTLVVDKRSRAKKLGMEIEENLVRLDFTEMEILKGMELKRKLLHRPWYIRLWEAIKGFIISLIEFFRKFVLFR